MPETSTQHTEFRLAKGWAIATYIISPALIALFLWLLIEPFVSGDGTYAENSKYHWWLAIAYVAGILLFVYALADCRKSKAVLTDEKLFTQSLFSYRELYLDEIKGFRRIENYILVEPLDATKKKLQISTYYGRVNDLVYWLSDYYPDLDVQELEDEYQTILEDENLGRDVDEREEKLARARKSAKYLNWAGGLAIAWAWFYPEPYQFAMLACITIPIVGMLASRMSDGLIRFNDNNNSAYPNVVWATLMPTLGLMIRAMVDFDIYDYTNVWIASGVIALAGLAVLMLGNPVFRYKTLTDYLTILLLAIVMFVYGFGSSVFMNCYYDTSEPETYSTTITDKRKSTGKTTTYYLELAPQQGYYKIEEVSVSKEMYQEFESGDQVTVYVHEGWLDIPWYYVSE
ncbi:hypothetical protein [Pontibacter burrus]|uniref:Uncharacterized protein n=1 Tax=Pontibacter burrus TaxID=2704466 RepID=A0A6B3LRQ6_9BACT|nr:hypothetical protein [Pontibacter burrus]NEM98513.1 hypothetical protein [Pontibacter burrus]